MTDFESIRDERYQIAQQLWDKDFFSDQKLMKNINVVNKETDRIFILESQYKSAKQATDEMLTAAEEGVMKLEKAANQSSKDIKEIEQILENNNKNQNKTRALMEDELNKSNSTYNKATSILNDRISKAQDKINELRQRIDEFQPIKHLKNPQAQELWIQLKQLLSSQQQELRSLKALAADAE